MPTSTDTPSVADFMPAPEAPSTDTSSVEVVGDFVPTHVVLRRLHAVGCDRALGEVVDATDWRNADRLVGMRYLRPIAYGESPVASDDGRHFIDDDALLAHIEATIGEED